MDTFSSFSELAHLRDSLPTHIPETPFVEKKEIPDTIRQKMADCFEFLRTHDMDMPFIHITPKAIRQTDETLTATGFTENIQAHGLSENTNGAVFISREANERWEEAHPDYFREHPEIFIEDLRRIVQQYRHHGIRTNKKNLGYKGKTGGKNSDYTARGEGIPFMFIADATGIERKRGVDGLDHFQTMEHILPSRIMGGLDMDIDIHDKNQLLQFTQSFLAILEQYIDQKKDYPQNLH